MNYKKEIAFLLNSPYQILHSAIAKWTITDGDNSYADERYSSEVKNWNCFVVTNFGQFNFTYTGINTSYEQYYGETDSWHVDDRKETSSHYLDMGSSSHSLNKDMGAPITVFLGAIENTGQVFEVIGGEQSNQEINNFSSSIENLDSAAVGAKLSLFRIPDFLLDHLFRTNKNGFEGLNLENLKKLNKALHNSVNPEELLHLFDRLPDDSQINSINFAANSSETEVSKLLQHSTKIGIKNEDELSCC